MDQRKVQAVESWPQPSSIKELQWFLGFANFNRRFINNFSKISSPLTSLLRNGAKSLSWNSKATTAFNQLKKAFCTAPALAHFNPELPFIFKVYTSIKELCYLSGMVSQTPSMCLYSKKLSPAELLSIKLALEE